MTSPRRQRQRSATVLAAGAVVLAACGGVGGGTGGGDGGGEPGAEGGGTVRTAGFSVGDVIAESRVDRFESEHPDVTLRIAEGAFDEQQFLSAVAGGTPPDAVYLGRDVLGSYAARGALLPVEECGIDLTQFRETAVEQVTYDGTAYGVPEFFQSRVVIASEEALRSAGTDLDELDTGDYTAIEQLNGEATRIQGNRLRRIGFDPKLPEFFPLWAWANGAPLLSDDGLTANLGDPAAVEALEFTAGLVEESGGYADHKAFKDGFDFFGAQNQFVRDQLGAFPMENWYVTVLAEASPDVPVGVTEFRTTDGEPITWATGQAWVIPKGAQNVEGACTFLESMTEQAAWEAAAQARMDQANTEDVPFTGVFTGHVAADETIHGQMWQPSGKQTWDDAVRTIFDVQEDAFVVPASPAGAEFQRAWTDAVIRVLEGRQSPQEALEQAQQEAQDALDEAAR
jgi:multiple sugar transport system substrate-binding protein